MLIDNAVLSHTHFCAFAWSSSSKETILQFSFFIWPLFVHLLKFGSFYPTFITYVVCMFTHVFIPSTNIYWAKRMWQYTELFVLSPDPPFLSLQTSGEAGKETVLCIGCNTSAAVLCRENKEQTLTLLSHLIPGNAKWKQYSAFYQLPTYIIHTYISLCI